MLLHVAYVGNGLPFPTMGLRSCGGLEDCDDIAIIVFWAIMLLSVWSLLVTIGLLRSI